MILQFKIPKYLGHGDVPLNTFKDAVSQRFKAILHTELPQNLIFFTALLTEKSFTEAQPILENFNYRIYFPHSKSNFVVIVIFDHASASEAESRIPRHFHLISPLPLNKLNFLKSCFFETLQASARAHISAYPPSIAMHSFCHSSFSSRLQDDTALLRLSISPNQLLNYEATLSQVYASCSQMKPVALQPQQSLEAFCKEHLYYFVALVNPFNIDTTAASYLVWIFERSTLTDSQIMEAHASAALLSTEAKSNLQNALFSGIHRYFSELVMQLFWENNLTPPLINFIYSHKAQDTSDYTLFAQHTSNRFCSSSNRFDQFKLSANQNFNDYCSQIAYVCKYTDANLLVKLFHRSSLTALQQEASYASYTLLPLQRKAIEHEIFRHRFLSASRC